MRRWWILAALVPAAGAGWYFGSPWWTLWQIKSAAEKRDAKTLSSYIDYPALRADVRGQLRRRIGPARVDGPRDIGNLLAATVAGGAADVLVRPEGVRAMFVAGSVARPFEMRADRMRMERDGIDRFRLVKTDGKGGALVFRRHGLGWKLSGVVIPDGALKL